MNLFDLSIQISPRVHLQVGQPTFQTAITHYQDIDRRPPPIQITTRFPVPKADWG